MKYWPDILKFLTTENLPLIFTLLGAALLTVAALGKVGKWIDLDKNGRIVTGALGMVFLTAGVVVILVRISRDRFMVTSALIEAVSKGFGTCPGAVEVEVVIHANKPGTVDYTIDLLHSDDIGLLHADIDDKSYSAHPAPLKLKVHENPNGATADLRIDISEMEDPRKNPFHSKPVYFKCFNPPKGAVLSDTPIAPPLQPVKVISTADQVVLPGDFARFTKGAFVVPSSWTALDDAGSKSIVNGTVSNVGPTYQGPTGFPYVQLDEKTRAILMHPGTFETGDRGASVAYRVKSSGTYSIDGAFQRANNLKGAGTGVDVAVYRFRGSEGTTLWSQSILSNNENAKRFALIDRFLLGDLIRFVVFGTQDSEGKRDGTFDATYLTATIKLAKPNGPLPSN